jgi:hypothetical protein
MTSTTAGLNSIGAIPGANYTLFHVKQALPVGTYTLTYDLVASNKTHTETRQFVDVAEIKPCPAPEDDSF